MSKPDEESAFPGIDKPTGYTWPGMSLRDYFAGQVVMGIYANGAQRDVANAIHGEQQRQEMSLTWTAVGRLAEARVADMAYAVADAMLKARED